MDFAFWGTVIADGRNFLGPSRGVSNAVTGHFERRADAWNTTLIKSNLAYRQLLHHEKKSQANQLSPPLTMKSN